MKYAQYGVFAIAALCSNNAFALESISPISGENTGNPSISVVGSFTGERLRSGDGVGSSSFLPLSETEIIFGANIDPHARLDITMTGSDAGMAIEEGFITTTLPYGLNVKSGRKFLPIGRVNSVHPHALIYADRPNALVNILGPDVFIGEGVFVDRPFFVGDSMQAFTAGVFGAANAVAFNPSGEKHYAGLLRWTGVWDSSDFSTLELGSSFVRGNNAISTSHSQTSLADIHLAWKYQNLSDFAVNIESEWMRNAQQGGVGVSEIITDGGYLLADIGLNRNWRTFARLDYSRLNGLAGQALANEKALSAGVVWKVSEFQKLTLQYKTTRHALPEVAAAYGMKVGDQINAVLFRWVVAIGPHGAHAY